MSVYYHGSFVELKAGDFLEPRPTHVLNGKDAVFATPWWWFAVVMSAKAGDKHLDIGTINGNPYIEEQRFGMVDKFLKGKYAWIYSVSTLGFEHDSRLMEHAELISDKPVEILEVEFIPDILLALEKINIVEIIYSDDKFQCPHK